MNNIIQKQTPQGIGDSLTEDTGKTVTTILPNTTIPNPGVWDHSFTRVGKMLDQPGSAHVSTIQGIIPFRGGQGYAINCIQHLEGLTYDHSTDGADLVTLNVMAQAAPGNPHGSSWAVIALARVGLPGLPAADGYSSCIEADSENYGAYQPDPDRPNSKYGIRSIATGDVHSSVAYEARGSTNRLGKATQWFRVLFSTWADIVPGGRFLELLGRMFIDDWGRITLYNQPEPANPPFDEKGQPGITLFMNGGKLKGKKSDGTIINIG